MSSVPNVFIKLDKHLGALSHWTYLCSVRNSIEDDPCDSGEIKSSDYLIVFTCELNLVNQLQPFSLTDWCTQNACRKLGSSFRYVTSFPVGSSVSLLKPVFHLELVNGWRHENWMGASSNINFWSVVEGRVKHVNEACLKLPPQKVTWKANKLKPCF